MTRWLYLFQPTLSFTPCYGTPLGTVESYHGKHIVYPHNTCVNIHNHSLLIEGEYPSERRVSWDREE